MSCYCSLLTSYCSLLTAHMLASLVCSRSIPWIWMHHNHSFQRGEDIPCLHCRYSTMHLPKLCKNIVFGSGKEGSMGFM